MSRTTDQWKTLLDEATEGPWENREYGIGPLYADIYGGVVSENQKDEELAAAAPEAVAEVIRLREELEELLDDRRVFLELLEDTGGDFMEAAPANRTARIFTEIQIKKLTRILNPEEEA